MKRLGLLIIFLITITLTGCIKESNITEEKSNAVSEYMAGLLLKYDDDYDQDLMPMDELAEDDTTVVTLAPKSNQSPNATEDVSTDNNSDGTKISNETYTLSEVIGNNIFDIKYNDYVFTDTYPDDSESLGFSLTSRPGYQLMVITFDVKNISSNVQNLDLSKDNISYLLKFNGKEYEPLLTLLENDLQYINLEIASGKSKTVLLVFEISKDAVKSDMRLTVSKNEKTDVIKIK